MSHTSPLTILALVAGLAIGCFARSVVSATLERKDLAAIAKLHEEDIAVTLSQDPKGLADIWAEDGVRLDSGSSPVVGKKAIEADNEKGRARYPGFKVLSYAPEYKNIQIVDATACEWGEFDAQYRLSSEQPPVHVHRNALRVLSRQSDGSWKFAFVGLP
jgi:ketosteroid isomerase-like protein